MVKSIDRIISQLSEIPEEVWREVVEERLESMSVSHTESPQTTPEKPQTVDRVHVESSSTSSSDVDEEYGTDDNRGLELLSSVAVLVGEYEAKEDKLKQEEAYSGPTNKKKDKYKERVLNLWVNKFEQRSITSVEPVLQNPYLDSESSPSSSVSQSKNSRRPNNVKERRSGKKRKIVDGLEVEPLQMALPDWLLNMMMREENGYNPKLIAIKELFMSDLSGHHARLSVPFKQVANPDFLTEEETRIIDEHAKKNCAEGLSVDLVDPLMKKHVVDLRKWPMNGNWYYVFVHGWNNVVGDNRFEVGDVYPLWSFRSGSGKLCFALVPSTTTNTGQGGITPEESGQGNSLPGGDGASTSGESGDVPLSVPPSPPARDSSFSGQGR